MGLKYNKERMINAFTLLESLLVLSILCFIMIITTINARMSWQHLEELTFINNFKRELSLSQAQAIFLNDSRRIVKSDNTFKFQTLPNKQLLYLELPHGMRCTYHPNTFPIFNKISGAVSPVSKYEFVGQKTYSFTFQVGGGHYIYKEK